MSVETIRDIDREMAAIIARETGAVVEITTTGIGRFTVSGKTEAAQRAAHWLYEHNIASVDDYIEISEDGETYYYMVTVTGE